MRLSRLNCRLIFNLSIIVLLASNCVRADKNKLLVGVSYQNLQNEFIINIQDAIREEAKKLDIELIESDSQGKAENQISQIENFIARGVDAIILNPYDKEGSAPAVDIAVREKKPIIVLNSIVSNLEKADAYVGSDDSEAGRIAAQYIVNLLGNKGSYAIIHGPNGHSAEIQRTIGIKEVLSKYPDVNIVFEQSANWDRTQALTLMENWLNSGKKIDGVIAQNDEMALGAYKAIEAAGKRKEIAVIGIDAIQDALKAVANNKLAGTVFQNAEEQGRTAIKLTKDILEGKAILHNYYIPFQLVTKDSLDHFEF
ncbi:MAG: sugar ABC transporter substrate-binding protein [Ginsengibacter sp.]